MAQDYNGLANLMTDTSFRGRVKVACLHYAGYITGEPTTTAAHNTRLKWAANTLTNPDFAATQIAPIVVDDPAITGSSTPDASDVPDSAIQSATEAAINKIL